MNKDKRIEEIERMSHEIDRILIEAEKRAPYPPLHPSMLRAKALYDNGYRKASEVARNIFGNLRILAHIDFDGNICIRKDSFDELEKTYTEEVK